MTITKFIITCAARTGSTMLRHMLDSHHQVQCHGEVFKSQGILRFLKRDKRPFQLTDSYLHLSGSFKDMSIISFMEDILLSPIEKQQIAVGFKFKTDEYFSPSFATIASHVRTQKEIRVIHLRRKDLLAQYISHQNVLINGSPTVTFKDQSVQAQSPFEVNTAHLLSYMKDVTLRETKIEQELADHPLINVWYEDLIDRDNQSIIDILKFISVDPKPLNTSTKKIIQNSLDLVKNVSEVRDCLLSSPYHQRTDFTDH